MYSFFRRYSLVTQFNLEFQINWNNYECFFYNTFAGIAPIAIYFWGRKFCLFDEAKVLFLFFLKLRGQIMKVKLFLLLSSIHLLWIFANVLTNEDELNMDEELLFAKYQSLISATISGKDISDQDIPSTWVDDTPQEESIPEEFLQRMKMDEAMELLTDRDSENRDSVEFVVTTSEEVELAVRPFELSLSETTPSPVQTNPDLDLMVNDLNELSGQENIETSQQEGLDITKNEPERESFVEVIMQNESAISQETIQNTQEIFNESLEDQNINNQVTTEILLMSNNSQSLPTDCSYIPTVEGFPSYLEDNPIVNVLERVVKLESFDSVLSVLSEILSDFEFQLNKTTKCISDSSDIHAPCSIEASHLHRLKLVNSDEIVLQNQEIQVCKEQSDATISLLHKSEQQRDLSEIRLKKCRNEVTVIKVTAEQQQLAVEEAKVDLEYRLKELQRENARLKVSIEELKRNKLLHQSLVEEAQDHGKAGKFVHGDTNFEKNKGSDTTTIHRGSASSTGTTIKSPQHLSASSKSRLSSISLVEEESDELKRSKSVENNPFIESVKNSKSDAFNSNLEFSLGSLIRHTIPRWLRKQFFPYLLSFVVWEYKILISISNVIFHLVDPRIWNILDSYLIQSGKNQLETLKQSIFSSEIAKQLLDQQAGNNWVSYLFELYRMIEQTMSYLNKRYYDIAFSSHDSPKEFEGSESQTLAANTTTHTSLNPASSMYANVVDAVIEDLHALYRSTLIMMIDAPHLKLLFGNKVENASKWIILCVGVLLAVLLRRVIVGILVFAVLAIFFPIILVLLLVSSLVGIFMPRRKKIIKKKARKGAAVDQSSPGISPQYNIGHIPPTTASPPSASMYGNGGPPIMKSSNNNSYSSQSDNSNMSILNSNQAPLSTSPRTFIGLRP